MLLFIILRTCPLKGHGGAGTNPICHWVRGGVHPGQVASLLQDWHTEVIKPIKM